MLTSSAIISILYSKYCVLSAGDTMALKPMWPCLLSWGFYSLEDTYSEEPKRKCIDASYLKERDTTLQEYITKE